MGYPHELRPDMSVTDIAFSILKNRGKAIHFKELIAEVMRVKAIDPESPGRGRLIAQMHTEINLDSRFIHQGNGEWGLKEWVTKGSKVIRIRPETPAAPTRTRPKLRDDEEDDEEAFEAEEEDEYGLEESGDETESESDEYEEDE